MTIPIWYDQRVASQGFASRLFARSPHCAIGGFMQTRRRFPVAAERVVGTVS